MNNKDMKKCIHDINLKDDCSECAERLAHLRECVECASLYPDFRG